MNNSIEIFRNYRTVAAVRWALLFLMSAGLASAAPPRHPATTATLAQPAQPQRRLGK